MAIPRAQDFQRSLNGISGNSAVDVYAGYELQPKNGSTLVDSYGNPTVNAVNLSDGTLVKTSDSQNIDASGSGVIRQHGGSPGHRQHHRRHFRRDNIDINAQQNVNVTALAQGSVNVSSGAGSVSGTIIGVGGVNASGASIDANLESNRSVTGDTSGGKGLAPGTAANATASAASASDDTPQGGQTPTTPAMMTLKKKKQGSRWRGK